MCADDQQVGVRALIELSQASMVGLHHFSVEGYERLHGSQRPRHGCPAVEGQALATRRVGVDRAIDYRRDGWWKGLPPYDIVLDATAASR